MPVTLPTRLTIAFVLFSTLPSQAQSGHFFLRDTFCSNQLIIVGNQVFDSSNPTGTVVLPGAAVGGGDSTVHVELVFRQPVTVNLNQAICPGDTLWVNGTAYHANYYIGQEVVQEGAANGCDSIINVHLTVGSQIHEFHTDLCEGDTIFVNGTAYHALHSEGIETIPISGSCDSMIHVQLNIITTPFSNLKDTLCPDEFYIINGNRYDINNRAGYEILPNASSTGCDSIVAVDLEFRNLWLYIGEDREIVRGDTICITPQYGLSPVNFTWLPTAPCPDSTCADPCVRILEPSVFTLLATDVSGCVLKDEIKISISRKNHVYAPTVFSPDARWPDNYFYLECDHAVVNIRHFMIADRWGEIIYERFNIPPGSPEDGWNGAYNGKFLTPDTYVFYAELERFDGTTFEESGGFSLVR